MDLAMVPLALRAKLGEEAAEGLVTLFVTAEKECATKVMNDTAERFERRLVEEISGVRVDIAILRADLLKWSFAFWMGQVVVVATIVGVMLRLFVR